MFSKTKCLCCLQKGLTPPKTVKQHISIYSEGKRKEKMTSKNRLKGCKPKKKSKMMMMMMMTI